MPIYEYKCPEKRCGKKQEAMRSIKDRDEEIICDCGTKMNRNTVTAPNLGGMHRGQSTLGSIDHLVD